MNSQTIARRARPGGNRFVVYFKFCLAAGGSIGPRELKQLWRDASGAERVQVSRSPRYLADGFIYSLSAPPELESSAELEAALRSALDDEALGSVTMLTRICS